MTSLLSRLRERVERAAFDAVNARYVRGGLPVPSSNLDAVRTRRAEDVSRSARTLTDALIRGDISPADWRDAYAVELRRAHSQMYALGRGGWAEMGQAERQAVSVRLRSEFDYLRQFTRELDGLSPEQIAARMDMYASHLQTSFYEGQRAANQNAGKTQERRVMSAAEHCADCESMASEGLKPLGYFPVPGDGSACMASCACSLEFA